jgi:hypothetical protein
MNSFTVMKRTSPMHQMLRAKCHWGLHIGMLKPTLSIRAFGDPLVRARKAGVWMIVFLLLTNCSAKFDGYDPSTAMLRWIITHDTRD